jgi:hypothetical protein
MQEVQVGTVLIEEVPLLAQVLGLQSETYSGNWKVVQALDGFGLDRKLRAAGWNFFFMGPAVTGVFFGTLGAKKIQNTLQRIIGKVKLRHFNALEVTGIVAKRFLGVPYTLVSAHSRHIQKGCYLDGADGRKTSQHDAEWAKS